MPSTDMFLAHAKAPDFYEQTTGYLQKHMHTFLRPQERVLVCCVNSGPFSMAALTEEVLRREHAIPMLWGPDYRWQALLKQAFSSRATTIIGQPLIILGLAKLARFTDTPLFIRNVLLGGGPSERWMIESIQSSLDAKIYGCYDPVPGCVIAGFSCPKRLGVHIRSDAYRVEIVDDANMPVPEGTRGNIVLTDVSEPTLRYVTGEQGRLSRKPCDCGSHAPLMTEFHAGQDADSAALQEQLLSWSSVLDYRAARTASGLELELVTFPGQPLPPLPTCAKRIVRHWDPRQDMPFCLQRKKADIFRENH